MTDGTTDEATKRHIDTTDPPIAHASTTAAACEACGYWVDGSPTSKRLLFQTTLPSGEA